MRKNLPCPLGIQVGAKLARMTEPAVAALVEEGEPDERCSTCAFRAGTLPNGCIETVADAMKCGMEGEPFYCHDSRRKGKTCHGWYAMRVAYGGSETPMPWKFSHEYAAEAQEDGR